ncbi:ATP-binding protein [Demequina aurantiaca]|uniref:ATP-binding protein n=1 Tax=Demequina aurantiaca TaxID=676200 RepID=UPI003D351681
MTVETLDIEIANVTKAPNEQWRGESIQMVDWGNMSGHVTVELGGQSVLMTGESGTGKSTVLDAVLALMQSSSVRFNSASNATGGGRARSGVQRNELTYLTGKIDDYERADGEIVSHCLRPVDNESRWGALAMTFTSNTGKTYTIVRAYFVPRGASERTEIKQRCATIEGRFDLMQLVSAAESRFEKTAMRSLGLQPYDGPGPFHAAMYRTLGFGKDGDQVVSLLRRIQAGQDVGSVDELFSEVVLEKPETFAQADVVVESFSELKTTYLEMTSAVDKLAVLRPIVGLKRDLDEAGARLDDLDSLHLNHAGRTPFTMWSATAEKSRRVAALDVAERERPDAIAAARHAEHVETAANDHVVALTRSLEDASQGLTALEEREKQARLHVERVSVRRTAFNENIKLLRITINTRDDHASLMANLGDLTARIDEQRKEFTTTLTSFGAQSGRLEDQHREINAEITSLKGRRGRIPAQLDAIRNTIAAHVGWSPDDLPFVGELVDVPPEHEGWRQAAEAVFASVATRLVVPASQRHHFQRSLDSLRIDRRINFDFATDSAPHVDTSDSRRLISHLIFNLEFQYSDWLIDRIDRAGGRYLCVEDASGFEAHDNESRVARSGQVSHQHSGAHGGGKGRILGFSNEDLIELYESRLSALEAEMRVLDQQRDDAHAQFASHNERSNALKALTQYSQWPDIDVATADRDAKSLRDQIEQILNSDDKIRELRGQLESAKSEAKEAADTRMRAEDHRQALKQAIGEHEDQLRLLDDDLAAVERGEVTLTQAHIALCDAMADKSGLTNDVEGFASAVERVRRNLLESIAPLQSTMVKCSDALRLAFGQYRRNWGDVANDSTDVAEYSLYAGILADLVRSGLDGVRDDWCAKTLAWSADDLLTLALTFRDARGEIQQRIKNVNDLLVTVPFGAGEDRLQLEAKKRIPPRVRDWEKELRELANDVPYAHGADDGDKRFREIEMRFKRIEALVDKISADKGRGTTEDTLRRDILDVRRHVKISAHRLSADTGERVATYSSFAAKSGGETQELTAFITGAALRFRLGSADGLGTRYTPVFLDEGFVKADGKFTGRAVRAYEALGFQLIVAAPVEKFSAMEPYLQRLFVMSKDSTGRGYCDQLTHEEAQAKLGASQ